MQARGHHASRLIAADASVTFRYKDYRIKPATETHHRSRLSRRKKTGDTNRLLTPCDAVGAGGTVVAIGIGWIIRSTQQIFRHG
jgi:hypothetical protein